MTSSGECSVKALMAAWPLLKGKTSCPSRRSNSETICTMVRSSSTNKTLAIGEKLKQSQGVKQEKWEQRKRIGIMEWWNGGKIGSGNRVNFPKKTKPGDRSPG